MRFNHFVKIGLNSFIPKKITNLIILYKAQSNDNGIVSKMWMPADVQVIFTNHTEY